MILSDREQQLTLNQTVAATLFVVCLLLDHVAQHKALILFSFAWATPGAKIGRARRANGGPQIQ
jgi:hypothetical protein